MVEQNKPPFDVEVGDPVEDTSADAAPDNVTLTPVSKEVTVSHVDDAGNRVVDSDTVQPVTSDASDAPIVGSQAVPADTTTVIPDAAAATADPNETVAAPSTPVDPQPTPANPEVDAAPDATVTGEGVPIPVNPTQIPPVPTTAAPNVDLSGTDVNAPGATIPDLTQNPPVNRPAADVATEQQAQAAPTDATGGNIPADPSAAPADPDATTHVVNAGETLHHIAQKYNVSITLLYEANINQIEGSAQARGLSSSSGGQVLPTGTELTIPKVAPVDTTAEVATEE